MTDWQKVIIDEIYNLPSYFMISTADRERSKVLITFNRPFTWAEREFMRSLIEIFNEISENGPKILDHRFTYGDASQLTVVSELDSREIVDVFSEWVEWEYLNLFPKSVKTIEPKVRV